MERMAGKIDLHMHSTISDGTDRPLEILQKAKEAGLALFSLTDHDAISGCETIANGRAASDPAFLAGVEFSTRDEGGKYHILGYGCDPQAEAIQALVAKAHGIRMNKLLERLDFLREKYGFDFSPEDIEELKNENNPGKPHIANLMVKYGYAATKDEGIRNYLNKRKTASSSLHPAEAIEAIAASGGIPVLAHPIFGSGDELIRGADLRARVERLTALGLKGLECYYSGYEKEMTLEAVSLAHAYDLFVTAGSDYHGTNKKIELGDSGADRFEDAAKMLRPFLEAIEDKIY